jgi:hypothetical protein
MTHIHASRRRLVLCALPLLVIAGCATAPPTEKFAVASPTPPPGSGRIVFFRTSNIFGFAMRADILLDQKVIGRSAPATKFSVDVTPGMHQVSVPNSVYSGDRTLQVPVKAGEVVFVRTWIGSGSFAGRTEVEVVSRAEGEAESAKLDTSNTR